MTLTDRFGRIHRDLRISLTDHCNLRCTYCMPAEGVPWLPRKTLLTPEDLIAMNKRSVDEKASASVIAGDWLKSKGLA